MSDIPRDDELSLGPCCACADASRAAHTIVMLPYRAPVPGTGWGCVVCGVPPDGAIAVLCEQCEAALYAEGWKGTDVTRLLAVCNGYPGDQARLLVSLLDLHPFGHDLSRHPERPVSPLDIQSTDQRFPSHAAEGESDCVCSRCGVLIAEDEVAVRMWPEDGAYEYRYHPACLGMQSVEDDDEEDALC